MPALAGGDHGAADSSFSVVVFLAKPGKARSVAATIAFSFFGARLFSSVFSLCMYLRLISLVSFAGFGCTTLMLPPLGQFGICARRCWRRSAGSWNGSRSGHTGHARSCISSALYGNLALFLTHRPMAHDLSRCLPASYAVLKQVLHTRHWLLAASWVSKCRTPWPSSLDILWWVCSARCVENVAPQGLPSTRRLHSKFLFAASSSSFSVASGTKPSRYVPAGAHCADRKELLMDCMSRFRNISLIRSSLNKSRRSRGCQAACSSSASFSERRY